MGMPNLGPILFVVDTLTTHQRKEGPDLHLTSTPWIAVVTAITVDLWTTIMFVQALNAYGRHSITYSKGQQGGSSVSCGHS